MRSALFLRGFVLSAFLVMAPFQHKATGQGLSLGGGKDDGPIEITAENGIEWWQPETTLHCTGQCEGDAE